MSSIRKWKQSTDLHAELVATLQLETSVLDPADAEGLADVLVECLPAVWKLAPQLLDALEWALDQIDDSLDLDHQQALEEGRKLIIQVTE